jgi:hypothetical protein
MAAPDTLQIFGERLGGNEEDRYFSSPLDFGYVLAGDSVATVPIPRPDHEGVA